MKKKFIAVLHINSAKEVDNVHNLCTKVISSMAANATTFPNPNPTLAILTTENATLKTLIADALSGNHQKVQARNEQSQKVLNMLRNQANYVSMIANGDRAVILLSGFESGDEPSPHPIPDKVVIKRVEDGLEPHSAKIHIEPAGTDASYIVQSQKSTEPKGSWKTVLQTSNSKNIILENLERGVDIFIRISAINARGQGDWSETYTFMAR